MFYTPTSITNLIEEHLPKAVGRILEPSVGQGDLLRTLESIKSHGGVWAVDTDKSALGQAKRVARSAKIKPCRFIHGDFLKLSESSGFPKSFDLILMNPPYSFGTKRPVRSRGRDLRVPIELAFLMRALDLLSDRGVLVAVLPPSLISGEKYAHVRSDILSERNDMFVIEMPEYTFPTVESRVYLLILKRSKPKRTVSIGSAANLIKYPKTKLNGSYRLDAQFRRAMRTMTAVLEQTPQLGWQAISSLARVCRGEPVNNHSAPVIHTTTFANGFWRGTRSPLVTRTFAMATPKDVLIQRVGRNATERVGVLAHQKPMRVSDCILVLKPFGLARDEFLLSLRLVLGLPFGSQLLLSGAAAQYVSAGRLKSIQVPTALAELYPKHLRAYRRAMRNHDMAAMMRIEEWVRDRAF